MKWWVYKCHKNKGGDWSKKSKEENVFRWGNASDRPALGQLFPGHRIIAHQTNLKELVGVCEVLELSGKRKTVILKWLETIKQKIPPLKKSDPDGIGKIDALQSGKVRTLYDISAADARLLLNAAREAKIHVEYLDEFKKFLPANDVLKAEGSYVAGLKCAAKINGGHIGPADLPGRAAVEPFLIRLLALDHGRLIRGTKAQSNMNSFLGKYAEMVEKLGLRPRVQTAGHTGIRSGDSNGSEHQRLQLEKNLIEGGKRADKATIRNPKLRIQAKLRWGLKCYCCGFNFEGFFGDVAKNIAIVHHLKPFSDKRRKVTVEDVRVVCANCHQVIHVRKRPIDVDELKGRVSERWTRWSEKGVKGQR